MVGIILTKPLSNVLIALMICGTVLSGLTTIKDMVLLSKPGSEEEKKLLEQIENRSHAASKGGTEGVTDAIGTPASWWWGKKN